MRFIKKNGERKPKLSFILLDWSVRESFHILHYLSRQTIDRDLFEVIVIEYYSNTSGAIRKYDDQVDTWVLLELPDDCYYHKHLMYNVGIALSRGQIVSIVDSDAMVKETFVENILRYFKKDSARFIHFDQFRNNRHDLYPFNYPSFEEVLGPGCINNVNSKTAGLCDTLDPLHTRNYGACMCARRGDLIAIGGADEHVDYLGHICGPYDMSFRLLNHGVREVWSEDEFTYHTWHPGQAGEGGYLGPHDGRHMSTTALQALTCGRVLPLVENAAVRSLRYGDTFNEEELLSLLIRPEAAMEWQQESMDNLSQDVHPVDKQSCVASYRGAIIYQNGREFSVQWACMDNCRRDKLSEFTFHSLGEVRTAIDTALPRTIKLRLKVFGLLVWPIRAAAFIRSGLLRVLKKPSLLLRSLSKTTNHISRGLKEQELFSSNIRDLIAMLLQVTGLDAKKSGGSKPLLVVLSHCDAFVLRFMVVIRLLPAAHVLLAQDTETTHRYFADHRRHMGHVFIQSSVYLRFHSEFGNLGKKDVIIA